MLLPAMLDIQASPSTVASGRTIVSIYVSPLTDPIYITGHPLSVNITVNWGQGVEQSRSALWTDLAKTGLIFRQTFVVGRVPVAGELELVPSPYLVLISGDDGLLDALTLRGVSSTPVRATAAVGALAQDRPSYGWSS